MEDNKILGAAMLAAFAMFLGFVMFNSYTPTGNVLGLPDFALKNQQVQKAYESAVTFKDKFQYLPCYCGCGMGPMDHGGRITPQMHSLKECFMKADGSGFEEHAAMDCGGCVNTALAAAGMLEKGASVKDTRSYIDREFGMGGVGMDTPLPPEGL